MGDGLENAGRHGACGKGRADAGGHQRADGGGRVTDTTRIDKIRPTVEDIIARGGKPVLLAHFDRPKGKVVPEMSLGHVASPR
jgi:hypothetical protein